jgi:hypothetical protein
MGKKFGFGSGMNHPDHISESLKTFFGVKYKNSLMWWIRNEKKRIRDPGWRKVGSGINIPDPQKYFCVLFELAEVAMHSFA